jgi:hypothetical protein
MRDKDETPVTHDSPIGAAVLHRCATAIAAWCRIHRAVAGDRIHEQRRARCLHNEAGAPCIAPARNGKCTAA